MSALTKKQVEQLLERYDDDRQQALLTCLRIVLDDHMLTWHQAVQQLPDAWNKDRLADLDVYTCDLLAQHLVEKRTLEKF